METITPQLLSWTDNSQTETSLSGVLFFIVSDKLFRLDLRLRYNLSKRVYSAWCKVFCTDDEDGIIVLEVPDMARKYIKELSLMGIRKAYEEVVSHEGVYFYNEMQKILQGREYIEDWDSLHVETYTNNSPDNSYPWTKVAECGAATKRRYLLSQTCPDCGARLVKSYYCTDGLSWKNLAGRSGMLTFCPNCQRQLDFHIEIMN